jgi:hypothetical protein
MRRLNIQVTHRLITLKIDSLIGFVSIIASPSIPLFLMDSGTILPSKVYMAPSCIIKLSTKLGFLAVAIPKIKFFNSLPQRASILVSLKL